MDTKSKTSSNQCEKQTKTKSKTSSAQRAKQTREERKRQKKLEQEKLEREERKRQEKLEREERKRQERLKKIYVKLAQLETRYRLNAELERFQDEIKEVQQKIKEKKHELSELREKHAKASPELTELQNQKAVVSQRLSETGIFAMIIMNRHQLRSTIADLNRRIEHLKEVKANYAASISRAEEYLDLLQAQYLYLKEAFKIQKGEARKRLSVLPKGLTVSQAALLVEEVYKRWGSLTWWDISNWELVAYKGKDRRNSEGIPYISTLGVSNQAILDYLESQNKIVNTNTRTVYTGLEGDFSWPKYRFI